VISIVTAISVMIYFEAARTSCEERACLTGQPEPTLAA
jgi:hypothetical protein